MILRRIGNKKGIAKKIQFYFPPHKIYVSPFFGAGGMYFNKPKAQYNIVNDIDSDVFNLFQVVMNRKEELEQAFDLMPIHVDLLNFWKKNRETDPIKKALRFLFLSNFTYLGKMDTLVYKVVANPKKLFTENIARTFDLLQNVRFNNCDFRKFFKNLSFTEKDFGKPSTQRIDTLVYNDGPYLGTTATYDSPKWCEQDIIDLLDINQQIGCKFAYSEFDHPFILQQAKERNLNVICIGERQTIKNRRTEILLTNYEIPQTKLIFE